jgi:hypothetical protein
MPQPEDYLSLHVSDAGGAPIDCAFEVLGLVGSRQLRLGGFTVKKRPAGSGTHEHCSYPMVPALEVEQVALVLRSSAEVARKTTDIFEIWDGELRLDPVRVERSRK